MKSFVALLLVSAALFVGCGDDDDSDTNTDTNTDGTTQVANPASVFCAEQGGTVEIETAADGSQSGICVLADGTRIEEWEYYRQETGITTTSG
jgi:putative hemolysin